MYWAAASKGLHGGRKRPKAARSLVIEQSRWRNHIEPELGALAVLEVRRAERRIEAGQRQKLEDDVAAFPTIARQMITSLEAIGPRDAADIQAAIATVRLFDQAARNVRIVEDEAVEGAVTISSDASKAKDDLKQVLIRKQRELFPHMRRTYAAHLSGAVAGLQANFRAVGADGKTLRAASPSFTSREVVMEAHYTLASQANRFRFSRAEYVYSLTGASDVIEMRGRDDGELR